MNSLGQCPQCGSTGLKIEKRPNGNTICVNGHSFPSSDFRPNNKFLKVMADYSSTGLWDQDGINVSLDNYNLSESTRLALDLWVNWYEENDDWKSESERKGFGLIKFSELGLRVAQAIKKDLPDFEIVYFDEFVLMA